MLVMKKATTRGYGSQVKPARAFWFGLALFFSGILLNRFSGASGWIDFIAVLLYGTATLFFMRSLIRSKSFNNSENFSGKIVESRNSASD